nr:protein SON isoform X2 [Pogona vitticeps]
MATNIEQIFRSFVLSKFREIQDQQFGGGKVGSQHNGEINSPDQVNPSDDTIPSIGNFQNDPLVQKIEQVLSEVLGTESQCKPDGGENIVRTKSAKRGLSEEVQDEIPRKKSKKDKKHKDKKKKKKRKKEKKDKKYKKQSKEAKLNIQEKECGDLQHVINSEPENSVAVLSSEEDVDMQFMSAVTQSSAWIQEKNAYENVNTAMSNSNDTDSDRNRSDMLKENAASVSIQEHNKVEPVNERELKNGPYQPTNTSVNLLTEDESLNIDDVVGGNTFVIRSGTSMDVTEVSMDQTEVSSVLKATEEVNVPENRPHFQGVEQRNLKTSLESDMLEAKSLNLVTESLNPQSMKQSVSASSEIYLQPSVEASAESKDSVTTLGFLAMVVGKDFEATSEFLNTAKVKASERILKHATEMKNDGIPDSERLVTTQDLQNIQQLDSSTELKDLPSPEAQHGRFEKGFEPISAIKPKLLEEELKRTVESDAQKSRGVASNAETVPGMRKLEDTQVSEIMELKDSEKQPRHLQTIMDEKDVRRTRELQVRNRKDLIASVPDIAVEAKTSDTTSKFEETEMRYLKTRSEHAVQTKNWNTVPEPFSVVAARNIDPAPECEEFVQVSCVEASVETVIEENVITEVDVPESISQFEHVPELKDLESIPETTDIAKPQHLEISKCINVREVENEPVVNLKNLRKGSETSLTVGNLECTSESQYVKDILQSATVAQGKDFQASLELEGEKREKDIDAASDSLHMIFANYSEHSLELYTEPTAQSANLERIPKSLVMMDADIREERHIRESKEVKSVESEINDGMNDLQKNIEFLHRNEKNVGATLESKVMPSGKYSDTLEAVSKEGIMDTVSHFVAGIEQRTPDTHEHVEKNQHDAEATDLHVLSRCQKVSKKGSKSPAENELFAGSKSLLPTSESFQETNILKSRMVPELKTVAAIQELKGTVEFATRMDMSSPEKKLEFKISKSSSPKHFSKFISTLKQVESVAESHAEQNVESLQETNTDIKKINLGSAYDCEIKHMRTSPEFLFSDELNNQQEIQKLEERTEIAGITAAPEFLYDSANDPIIVSESSMSHKVVESEYHPDSLHLENINSENILKPLYSIQVKDSQTLLESKITDAKTLETDSGATFQAGVEIADIQEGELKVPSEVISESHKKNEMLLGLHPISVLQESDEAFRSKAPTLTNLGAHPEILCVFDTENLEIPPQCEELGIVKKSAGTPPSLFAADMVERKSSSFISVDASEQLNAAKAAETVVTTENSKASTESVDMLEETFEPTCMTNLKDLEASQKYKTHPESLGRKEMNSIYTGSSTSVNGSEILKNEGRQISESVLKAAGKVEEKCSGIDLEPDTELAVKYSESISESITVSEKEDDDMSMTVFMVDVTDLEASSSCLDTRQTSSLETTIWIETTSTPVCVLQSRNSDGVVDSVPVIETKDLGQAVNSEKELGVKDAVTTAVQLNTLDLESLKSVSAAEVTSGAGILDLKTSPTCLDASDLKCSGTVAKTKALEVIDSEMHLKPENTSEVKFLETTLETECDVERHQYITAPISENLIEKTSKPVSEVVCLSNMEDLKSTSEPKYMETIPRSEKQSQLHLHFEGKCSEITVEHAHISDLRNTSANMDTVSLKGGKSPRPTSEIVSLVDVKSSKANSEVIVELNDKELFLKTGNALQFVHSVESKDIDAANKCKSLQEVRDLQVASASLSEEVQMDFEGRVKTLLALASQELEQNSTSGLLLEEKTSKVTVESSHAVHTNDTEPVPECVNARSIDISEQHSKCMSVTEVKDLEKTTEHVLAEAEISEEPLKSAKEKDLGGIPHVSLDEQSLKTAVKPVCTTSDNLEKTQQVPSMLKDSEIALECVHRTEKDLKTSEKVFLEAKDSEPTVESVQKEKSKDLEVTVEDSLTDQDSESAPKSLDLVKEDEESTLKDKKSEKSTKSKDKSKSGKKAKKSRSKSLSKSKKRKKKSRSRSVSRQVSTRRARSRSKNDSDSKKKHSTSRHKSRSKSADRKEENESSVRSRRRRSRSPDHPKSRSKSVDRRETSVRSRRRRSRSSDHRKSRSRSVDRKESVRRRRRLSQSSDNHRSRSRSVDRRETLVRTRRRRSRSSDHRKSRSQSVDKKETSVRRRRRRSLSSDHCKSRSRSLDRRESSIRTRRRRSRSSDHHKSRSRSADDRRESSVRTRRRRSRSPEIHKSRSRSCERRESALRTRRRRSRSSDNRRSKSKSVDKRETSVRTRRRRSRSSDNRRSKSKSVDKRETSVRTRRRRSRSSDNHRSRSKSLDRRETSIRPRRRLSLSSDRKSRSKSVDKRETPVRTKRRRSRSSDNRKSRSKSIENTESSARSKRRRSKSPDHKSGRKSVEKGEPPVKSRRRRSKSSDCHVSRSKSRSKSSERKKDKVSSDGSRGKHSRYRSKSKSVENTEKTESVEATVHNRSRSPEQHKSKSRSRSKSIDKTGERESSRRSRSKSSKSPETRSHRRRTVSRSRRNRSRSLTRKRVSRSKSDHRSRTRSLTRSPSRSRRWKRTRSRSVSRQRSLSRERRRRSRRNRSRSVDRRRRRSDSRDSYRISLRLRSRSRTPARLRCSRSIGRRRSPSKSPDHRRSRSSSRSPKRLTDLDKAQLLEIAKANAAAMCAKAGVPLPPSLMPVITPEKKEEKVTQKSAKETILELTEKCKKIAQSQEDDVIVNKPHVSDEEEEEHPFINHPFKLNEPKPIFFNLTTPTIKPAAPKNQVTLTKEFPVSSGSQHRKKEADSAYGEWVPVEKNKDEKKDDVFPNPASLEPVDISSALNERTIAQKRLTENTFDLEAMCLLNRAQERIDAWAELNSIPGHFTGSTGAQVLSSEQLSNSGPQAWVKKVFTFSPRIGYSSSSYLCELFLALSESGNL